MPNFQEILTTELEKNNISTDKIKEVMGNIDLSKVDLKDLSSVENTLKEALVKIGISDEQCDQVINTVKVEAAKHSTADVLNQAKDKITGLFGK